MSFLIGISIVISDKEDYDFGTVGLLVCLSVSNITQQDMNRLRLGVQAGIRNKSVNFGGNLDHHTDCPIRNMTITQQIMSNFDAIFIISLP